MPNSFFRFKQFTIQQDRTAMKVTTDGCLFGAWVAGEIQNLKVENRNVLDIGCGTGLLSLMVAQKNNIGLDAIEIDKDAAAQAMKNIEASPWKNRINVIHADVLQWDTYKKYHCIISNPPFYETELKSGKATKDIAHHDDGLKLSELLLYIKKHLTADGIFYLLLPAKREKEFEGLLKVHHLHLHKKVVVKQTTAHSPFRVMIKAANKKSKLISEGMAVKNSNEYTLEFIALLKDFYLYL